MDLLTCTVMPYPWGSKTALASLMDRTPSGKPEAELWMGAHPVASSFVERNGAKLSLEEWIARSPEREVGLDVVREMGPRLPFLLKVLAAAEPLSLQAHPSIARAREGFRDEERRGIPRDATHRNYKDASHKPELLCALTPFDALSGFRSTDRTLHLFDVLAVPELEPVLRPLRASLDARGLAETFHLLMTLPREDHERVVAATVTACRRPSDDFVFERALAARLADLHPGDIGVVSALFLDHVRLAPGEAIYLGPGNLHAYLEGVGVEIMASSDNVLRGGLTKKHVDVPELLDVLDFAAGPAKLVKPISVDEHEEIYETPAREFELSRITVSDAVTREVGGPEILLAIEGSVRAGDLVITKGSSAFVPASTKAYTLRSEGPRATIYRAKTNL